MTGDVVVVEEEMVEVEEKGGNEGVEVGGMGGRRQGSSGRGGL